MTILTAIRSMNVDHDKCQVLLALARTQRFDGALRDAYLEVAASLRLDYERTRALAAIGRR
jgi:chorismate mutase